MIIGDVIQVIDRQLIDEQRVLNTYYYSVTNVVGVPTIQDIAAQFLIDVVAPIADIQHNTVLHDACDIDNLSSTTEFGRIAAAVVGTLVGSVMPTFVAVGIKLLRSTKTTRNGSKRICGINEESITDGKLSLGAALITAVETAVSQAIVTNVAGNSVTLLPIIVGRTLTGALDLTKLNLIASGDVQDVTTQNSRKIGRGG